MNNQSLMDHEQEESIDLVETLYRYLKHWKWFILSMGIALFIAAGIILITKKEYNPSMSILLNEEKSGRGASASEMFDVNMMGFLGTTSNIENEIIVLNSPDLMDRVVRALNLNVSYYQKDFLRKVELHHKSPYTVTITSPVDAYRGLAELEIDRKDEGYQISGTYRINSLNYEIDIIQVAKELPVTIQLDEETSLQLALSEQPLKEKTTCYVEVRSVQATTRNFLTKLSVANSGKKSSVIDLSMLVHNTQKGVDLLYELLDQYNDLNLQVNNEIAYNSAIFINDRLKEISQELSDAETKVVEYKQEQRIADLGTEAQLFVTQSEENEQQLMELETQLNVLTMIQDFIKNPDNHTKTIPNMGVSDLGLAEIISAYNTKLLASDQLLKGTGEKNPARVRVFEELDNMREGINNSLANVRETYMVGLKDLRQRANVTLSRISSIPKQEKGLIEKVRNQKIKEELFLFLMQKREETNLSIAANAEKARIIASPRMNISPVSPKTKIILLAFLILGVLVPVVCIYVLELFRTKIGSREEFERLSQVSIIGEIGTNKTGKDLLEKGEVDALAEMFRTLRNNIRFALRKRKGMALLMTSTVSNEGKSFVSANLALSFAYTGKKVLLIGGDIRNPEVHAYFNPGGIHSTRGLSDYLADDAVDWKDYVFTPMIEAPTLHVLVAGTIPPNPNELLMEPRLEALIAEAKTQYDYVLIDSAPVGLVSDSYLIGEHTDMTLYVVREKQTPKTAVNFINMQRQEEKLKNMFVILNDVELSRGYKYGYGKGYGYQKKK